MMNTRRRDILFIFILVCITRIPFIFNGLGVEEDSYTLVTTSQKMVELGIYEMSRAPGHPFQELVINLFPYAPHFVLNGLSALFSFIAGVFFYLILSYFNIKNKLLNTTAFLCIPVVYLASVSTIDYVWALALMLMGTYYLFKEKHILVGLFLGIAVACRVTAIMIGLPVLIILLLQYRNWDIIKPLLKIGIPFLITVGLFFAPALYTYGIDFFYTYDLPYPNLPKILYKATFGVWGIWGVVALAIVSISLIKKILQKKKWNITHPKLTIFSSIMLLLYGMAYIFLPEKSAFWIPTTPFIILLINILIDNKATKQIILALFIVSPFISNIQLVDPLRGSKASPISLSKTIENQEIGFDLLYGPIISDYTKRKKKQEFTDLFIENYINENEKTLYLCGFWYAQIEYELKQRSQFHDLGIIKAGCSLKEAQEWISDGGKVLVLPEQEKFNNTKFGHTFVKDDRVIFY